VRNMGMTIHARSLLLVVIIPLIVSHTTTIVKAQKEAVATMDLAAQAINALGVDQMAQCPDPKANLLISPYSIQCAMAMTFAGAEGDTRVEMAKVLHYPEDETELHQSFAALQRSLEDLAKRTATLADTAKKFGRQGEPVILTVANRLYGQHDYEFRTRFLSLVNDNYGAPLQPMDFIQNADSARLEINRWVEVRTKERIRDLIPPNGIDRMTRLVLVNAVYLKAPWAQAFSEAATQPQPFHIRGDAPVDVPTMMRRDRFGYVQGEGYKAVTIPYLGGELHFLILLPDELQGLPALESKSAAKIVSECAQLKPAEIILYLPKLKLEPPLMLLSKSLKALGMKQAFDDPKGSAHFERMAPRKPDDYLCLSEVFHKTFLALDEKGTEAAAATAAAMVRVTSISPQPAKPVEVRVDHPFLFAVQHRSSGACLFLGRVTDPR
jgi:serpin B